MDKRVVETPGYTDDIWWGKVNIKTTEKAWEINYRRAIDFLNTRKRLILVDGYAGWDPKYRIKVRIICSRAYHALFMHNMMIRPTKEELVRDFSDGADYYIINSGVFPASPLTETMTSETSVNVNFKERKMVILGTQYAGEMKKGLFGIMHYLMPKKGVVSLHASANEGPKGDTTLLFGLSGTGKTTLSADPNRLLIGDDEHCWSDDGIFNIEGGCYAKCVNLSRDKEPEIYDAIRFGAVLENIRFHGVSREVNYDDISITENTRLSYPLEFMPNVKIPAIGGHPKNIIFLTCDAYGVLPPVVRLTPE
jgi:phosphoenolpyruvate carboxykinase (ATP)